MTIYCGVDFHARVQTVSYCDSQHGEIHTLDLHHQTDDLLSFYSQFKGEVVVRLEAGGYSPWFEQTLEELGHEAWLGVPQFNVNGTDLLVEPLTVLVLKL